MAGGTCRADRARAAAAGAAAGRRVGFDELATPFQTLTPRAAKGLEFDRVVLVEPEAIAAEGDARIEGLRALYVALTRATKTLVVVHALPLPASYLFRTPPRRTPGPTGQVQGQTPDLS